MGMHAQDTAELFFNDVKVPKANILGEPDKGFYYLMQGLAEERLITTTSSIAGARVAFNMTRELVMQRKVFGKPLSKMQNTEFKMAEMDTEIDMVQVYTDHCVAKLNQGELTANMAAKGKLMATEVEWKMLDLGVQMHGGAGFMKEYEISYMFSSARVNRILAGSSEIMKYIIGRDVFSDKYASIFD
jgi:acyl-CoA dehydrogenase